MTGKSWRRMTEWVTRLLLLTVLALVALGVAVLVVLPRATHGAALNVLTGSMTPGIPVGSVVLVRPADPDSLRVGDVATYQKAAGKAEFITHRIVRIDTTKTPSEFIFKGDANRGEDLKPVSAAAVRGKVWFHVPYLGTVRDGLHTPGGLAKLGSLLLIGYALTQLAGGLKERRTAGRTTAGTRPHPTAVDEAAVTLEPRNLILVTLRLREFEGLSAVAVANLFRALLLDSDGEVATLLMAEPPNRAAESVRLLNMFGPVTIQMSTDSPRVAAQPSSALTQEAIFLTSSSHA